MLIPLSEGLSIFASLEGKVEIVKESDSIWPEQARLYEERGARAFFERLYEKVLLPAGLVPKRTHKSQKQNGDEKTARRNVNEISFHALRHTFVSLLKITGAS